MDYFINSFVVIASIVVLFFAFFKKSELGKLSIYVIFASMLLQELFGIMVDWSLFSFITNFLNSILPFIIYGEIILLIVLLVSRLKNCKKELKIALIALIVLKIIAVII